MTMQLATSFGKLHAKLGVIRAGETQPEQPAPDHPLLPGIRSPVELRNPLDGQFKGFAESNRSLVRDPVMLKPDACKGKTLALCGAGPSLARTPIVGADQVWACNSALTYLLDHGQHVDAAVGIDQTEGLAREWASAPDVPYYLASTCNPALIAHLVERERSLSFFHNLVGLAPTSDEEVTFYRDTWPRPAFVMCHGATVVSRAVQLATWLGFERIDVYGADCSLGPGDTAHANGESAMDAYGDPAIGHGVINGRVWRARPDMLMCAVDLARYAKYERGRVRLMGDTLPVALQGKDDAFLDLVMKRCIPGEPLPDVTLVSVVPTVVPTSPAEM